MSYPSNTNLEKYKKACEALRDNINLAIRDLEFVKDGGTLRYAVDFSEIFAYILPSESFRDFIIFPDAFDDRGEIAEATALQQLVLKYIFLDLSPYTKLVLLAPYLLEFRTFVQSLPTKLFVDSVGHTLKVFNDLEKIINDNTSTKIETICRNIEDYEPYTASDEEEEILANFVQEYGYIQSFLERGKEENHPFSRVKHLLPGITFATLDELIVLTAPLETEVYDRWVEKLQWTQKKIASTELDAAAINLIYEVNRNLDKNTRLVLITRSTSMHEIYNSELNDGLWEDAGEYPLLRHPRVFSIVLAGTSKSNIDDLQDLQDLSDSIGLFLENYEARRLSDEDNDQILTNQINSIKRDWKSIQKTVFPLISKSTSSSTEANGKNVRQARSILEYVRNTQSVRNRITKILDDLFYEIDIAHDVLGLELQLPMSHLSPLSTPRKVNFTTEAGRNILNNLFLKSKIKTEDIVSIYKKVFGQDEPEEKQEEVYERNLAMAYMLGSLFGQWGIAENYCLRAIKIGERSEISTHEALYFLAVCKREATTLDYDKEINEDWLLKVLNLLDIAIEKARNQELEDHIVARYWVEKSISIISFHKAFVKQSDKLPTATEALNLLAQWDEKLESELPLRLFILRTELDYVVSDKRFREFPRLKDKFMLLERQLKQLEIERSEWSPYIVDLMYWGRYVFFPDEFKDPARRGKLVKRLREARESESSKDIREEIYRHMKDVEKG